MLICRRSSGGCADCLPPVRVLFLSAKHLFLAAKPRSGGVRAVGVFRALCNQPPAAPLMEGLLVLRGVGDSLCDGPIGRQAFPPPLRRVAPQ